MKTTSLWRDTQPAYAAQTLRGDTHVDALVVGAGIAGLTSAYLLRRHGLSVALVEKGCVGQAQTGHTTAHVTYVTDVRLSELVRTFGRDNAKATWDAGANAMAQIQAIASEATIDCELGSVPGFMVAAGHDLEREASSLKEEAELAASMGFDAAFVRNDPLYGRPALRVSNQLKFHPLKYVVGIAREFARLGGQIFEGAEVADFQDEPREVTVNGYRVSFNFVVLATHVPLQGNRNTLAAMLLQTKLAAYSTYAVEAEAPLGALPELLWWDTADPYCYIRVDRRNGFDSVIVGGEDHKTGQETDTEKCFERLERRMAEVAPSGRIRHRWSGQVIEPVDGLPYIGEVRDGQFLATGFAGNGMTFGTLAGMMARDAAAGIANPWRGLFAIDRKTLKAAPEYLRENSDYPYYLAKGHFTPSKVDLEELPLGGGAVVIFDSRKCAAYRSKDGELHIHSAVCPHLGCVVSWNNAEQTWDCPCHGSRFAATGEVIAGPAEKGLEEVSTAKA